MVDINAAIDAFSHALGNNIEPLKALCRADSNDVEPIAASIVKLQDDIFDLIRSRSKRSKDGALPLSEIEQIAREYLAAANPEVNELGYRGLMRFIVWMAWHDGWLQREKP